MVASTSGDDRPVRGHVRGGVRRVVVCVLGAVMPVAAATVYLVFRDRLPERLPTHWDAHGAVDGTSSAVPFVVWMLSVSAALAVVVIVGAVRTRGSVVWRLVAASDAFATCGTALLTTVIVLASVDAHAPAEVALPGGALWGVLGVSAAVGIVTGALMPTARHRDGESGTGSAVVDAGPVIWRDTVRSTAFTAIGVVCAAGTLALCVAALAEPLLLVFAGTLFFLAILAAFTYKIVVTIDQAGLHVAWGLFRRPRTNVALGDIKAVRTETIKPMQWGGWGYRLSDKGAAIIVRGGPAIVVDRFHDQPLAVTTTHADDGAAHLDQLLTRTR